MRNVIAMAAVALLAMAVGSAVPFVNGAPPQAAQGQNDDMPHRTTKAFVPFIRALVTHRKNQAAQVFNMRRNVQTALDQPENVRILAKFQKPDLMELNLVGGRMLGQNMGTLYFTVATEDGPVAFKIYYYGFGDTMTVARIDMTDDWDEVERMSMTVDPLPMPITMSLGQVPDENPAPGG